MHGQGGHWHLSSWLARKGCLSGPRRRPTYLSQMAQSRSCLDTLRSKVGMINILGAIGYRRYRVCGIWDVDPDLDLQQLGAEARQSSRFPAKHHGKSPWLWGSTQWPRPPKQPQSPVIQNEQNELQSLGLFEAQALTRGISADGAIEEDRVKQTPPSLHARAVPNLRLVWSLTEAMENGT